MNDISFVHAYDKASPKLLQSCVQGTHIKSGIITVRKAGGKQQDYLTYKMSDLLVSSIQIGGGANDVPAEQVSLNFSKFEVSYLDGQSQRSESAFCGGSRDQ
jgi:type VI secretion system secreted protein Hcp